MPDANDMDLVREFARDHSEAAFTELVRRHLNLVYSVARRCTGNDGDAHDVAQAVFIILARKAAGLREKTLLTGWLYETTRFAAARLLRTNARRHAREQEAYMQSTLNEADNSAVWEKLSPHLEAAMDKLNAADRALLVLRFYENKSGPETAALMGIREDTAHKRVARAIEKLRKFFVKRGVALTATAIAGAVSANSVQAAPVGLAVTVTAAAAKGAAVSASILILGTSAKRDFERII
jgi:RNA polymerase sigma factor (sigma-70 family)